jgi:glycosyltransferase involved in cell wall biosynthesis
MSAGTAAKIVPGDRTTQFHILSFEGPDPYARAGGLGSRVSGLSAALAELGFATHLWFVGDPDAPGHETSGNLRLHRWCQWISRYHPAGVYDGEEGKRQDYAGSLPPYLLHEVLGPHLASGGHGVVLAEDWHTADVVLHLDWLLRGAGLRDRVALLWNANNTFGFDRIEWERLRRAVTLTTVSRYMRHVMARWGVSPLVIANGLGADAFAPCAPDAVREVRRRVRGRMLLTKVARWDPEKGWMHAVEIVCALKRLGWCPLLVARGGLEAYGVEVRARAAALGLRVAERTTRLRGPRGVLEALDGLDGADVAILQCPLDADGRRVLLRAAAAVLANSHHEPFGLVGLETMAARGLACTGCSGEDYAVPGWNAVVLETQNPNEFVGMMHNLSANPGLERAMRRAGEATARQYAWAEIVGARLLPCVDLLRATQAAA